MKEREEKNPYRVGESLPWYSPCRKPYRRGGLSSLGKLAKAIYDNEMNTIIIVSGLPASGKTTLGNKLAEHFEVPLYSKDTFKEVMFDTIGWEDREWSQRLSEASLGIIYQIIETEAASGRSIIVEGNFQVEKDKEKFQKLQKHYHFEVVEVMCEADGKLLFERFKKRVESGHRHPGHRDEENLDHYREGLLTAKARPLDLGKVIHVDTNDFDQVDYEHVFDEVKSA